MSAPKTPKPSKMDEARAMREARFALREEVVPVDPRSARPIATSPPAVTSEEEDRSGATKLYAPVGECEWCDARRVKEKVRVKAYRTGNGKAQE